MRSGSDSAPRSQRQYRVGELVRRSLADIFARGELRDPNLIGQSITVTEVVISPDLRNATAWIMPLGGEGAEQVAAALNRCSKYLRSQIARSVALKYVPTVQFRIDPTFDQADHIDRLLHQLSVERDLGSDPTDPN
mgnify:CR=1 FL=1